MKSHYFFLLSFLIFISSCCAMTDALLRVSIDPGHGGLSAEYEICSNKGGYSVTLKISELFPNAGKSNSKPLHITEVLVKNNEEVEGFLRELSRKFNIYELPDLKPSHPFLHPTFYSFSFKNSSGKSHSFDYWIECSNHLDERYRNLIREFENFFDSKRIFSKFYEIQKRNK